MKRAKTITRGLIIQAFVDTLKPLDYVYAFYEGGAVAFGRIDEWSDIDLYVVVEDEKVDETFLACEKTLKSLSPIEQKIAVPQLPWPGISQAFYKLKNASKYLIIDLAVLKLSAPDKLLEPEIHGNVEFYFNKSHKIKPSPVDRDAFVKKLKARLERLRARFDMFNNFTEKEIYRGNNLEAIEWYHAFTLSGLVEALRIRHNPFHHDFRMRYIHYELPADAIQKLERLYFIRDEKDLKAKYREASKWFQETMRKIEQEEIAKLVKK